MSHVFDVSVARFTRRPHSKEQHKAKVSYETLRDDLTSNSLNIHIYFPK